MRDGLIVGPETVRDLVADMRKRTFRDQLAASASRLNIGHSERTQRVPKAAIRSSRVKHTGAGPRPPVL